jgi:hypothetical protein
MEQAGHVAETANRPSAAKFVFAKDKTLAIRIKLTAHAFYRL